MLSHFFRDDGPLACFFCLAVRLGNLLRREEIILLIFEKHSYIEDSQDEDEDAETSQPDAKRLKEDPINVTESMLKGAN